MSTGFGALVAKQAGRELHHGSRHHLLHGDEEDDGLLVQVFLHVGFSSQPADLFYLPRNHTLMRQVSYTTFIWTPSGFEICECGAAMLWT